MKLSELISDKRITFKLVFINEKIEKISTKALKCLDDTALSILEFIDLLNNHKICDEGGWILSNKSKFASISSSDKNIYRMAINSNVSFIPEDVFVIADNADDAINIMVNGRYCRDVLLCWEININNIKGE